MKIRTDFVTNSSSSSFIIAKKYLTPSQLESIRLHSLSPKCGIEDSWDIEENDKYISGNTFMDNFDFESYMTKELDIPENIIHWSEYSFDVWSYEQHDNISEPLTEDEIMVNLLNRLVGWDRFSIKEKER